MPGRQADAASLLRGAGLVFALGFTLHALDHVRRGLDASPPRVLVVGTIQGVLVALAILMALRGHPRAPIAAVLAGFGSALLFTSAHLLPSGVDSFVSPPATNVTWASWASAVGEIGTGLLFGAAGIAALRRARPAPRT